MLFPMINKGIHQRTRAIQDPPPEQPDQRALVSSPLTSQEQYTKILAMLSSGSINSQANLAGIALCTINFCLDY